MTLESLFSLATFISLATGYTIAYRGLVIAVGFVLKGLRATGTAISRSSMVGVSRSI